MRCAVFGCVSDNQTKDFKKNIKFFRFPQDPKHADKWKHLCKRSDNINVKTARICSKHFCASDYKRNLKEELLGYTSNNHRKLKEEALPNLNMPTHLNNLQNSDRTSRLLKRQRKDFVESILHS